MPKLYILLLTVASLCFSGCSFNKKQQVVVNQSSQTTANSIHSLSAEPLLSDTEKSLADYNGKVLLIVNTASKCGLTPQYEHLQKLHQEYNSKGLAVLGFPSNNFMNQEPGTEGEIASFCEKNYGVTFDMFQKVNVKGKDKHPIYQFLTEKEKNGVLDSEVSWNFQKYLLNKNGELVAVFSPKIDVYDANVIQKIDSLLLN